MPGPFSPLLRQYATQPQTAATVAARYRPIGGLLPSAYGLYDTSGAALTVGTGYSRAVFAEGVSLSTLSTTTGLTRAITPTTYPATFVFSGRAGPTTGYQCISSLATSADKTLRVFARDGLVDAQAIGATAASTATTTAVWSNGLPLTIVAVFASATDVRVYAAGTAGVASASSIVDTGAVTSLNILSYGLYRGASTAYPFQGSTALAQWLGVALSPAEARGLLRNPWAIFTPTPARIYTTAAAGGTAALTGRSSAGAAGSVAPSSNVALTGVSSAAAAGAITVSRAAALTGAAGTGTAGTLGAAVAANLAGASGAGSAGTVSASQAASAALSGTASTGSTGSVSPASVLSLTGMASTGQAGTLGTAASIGITGSSSTATAGTQAASVDTALASASSTGSAGAVSASQAGSSALTGTSSAGAPGAVSVGLTAALTGASSSSTAGTLSSASTLALLGLTSAGATGSVAPSLAQALTGASSTATAGSVSVFSADVTVSLFGVSSPGSAGTVTQTGGTPPPDPFIAIIGGGIARKLKKQREDEETELAKRVAAQALAEAQLTEFVPAPRAPRAPRMTSNGLTDSVDGTAAAVARKARQRSEDDLMLMY